MYSKEELRSLVNKELVKRSTALITRNPTELYIPVSYSIEMGGKRLRPVLLLMAYNLFSEEVEKALPAALAVEVFHNFTLLHDDIMDKAEIRRNQPCVHIQFGENNAILSGDAMAFLSYQLLLECPASRLRDVLGLFTDTALEVCEGQQYDMDFENRMNVTEEEYLEMIKLKTAVLLGCSMKAGALLANASDDEAQQLYNFGINLGIAFQLQDDWLDTFGDRDTFGKKIGGDILANKKTYLLVKALEKATGTTRMTLEKWLGAEQFDGEEKVASITGIYEQLGIGEMTQTKIDAYFYAAEENLNELSADNGRKEPLRRLSRNMPGRSS